MLKPNDIAPDFTLSSTAGGPVALKSLRGKKVVLYFYPRDDTPGCTREACDFRDNLARVKAHGAVLLGVSKDKLAAHDKFRAKYALPFDLLSDPDNAVAKSYGAYGRKMMYGRAVEGTIRSTFLIDEKGRIEALWSPVKVEGHADAVIAALSGQASAAAAATIRPAKAKGKPKPVESKVTPSAKAGAKSAARKKSATRK